MKNPQQDLRNAVKRFLRDPAWHRHILLGIWRGFGVNFVKAWLFRSGASLLFLLIRLLKTKDPALFWDIWRIFLAKTSINFGLFAASYFALFKGLEEKWVPMFRERFAIKDGKWDTGIAGALSAITMLLFEHDESMRKILGHYSAVRAFQVIYNQSSLYKVWGDWLYVALFMLSSGQVVYSYVKRPEALDPGYVAFLTRVTAVHPIIVQTIRNKLWDRHIDFDAIAKVVPKYKQEDMSLTLKRAPTLVGCAWMHPGATCTKTVLGHWPYVFKLLFPVYGSLHAIPPMIFRPGKIRANPLAYLKAVLLSTFRSASFMATYMFLFRAGLCGYRNAMGAGIIRKFDAHWLYGLLGFLGSIAVLIEKGHRRVELCLYALPKAVAALIAVSEASFDIRLTVPHGNVLLFSAAMSILMSSYRKNPEQMPSIVSRILRQFVIAPQKVKVN